MLETGETYHDPGGDYFTRRDPERAKRRALEQLQHLGYTVTCGGHQRLRRGVLFGKSSRQFQYNCPRCSGTLTVGGPLANLCRSQPSTLSDFVETRLLEKL